MKAKIDKNGVLHITPQSAKEAERLDNWIEDNQHLLFEETAEALKIVTSLPPPRE